MVFINRRNPEHISVNSNNLFDENNESTARSLNVKLLSIFKLYVIIYFFTLHYPI